MHAKINAVDDDGPVTARVALNRTLEDYYLLVMSIADCVVPHLSTHTVFNIHVITPGSSHSEFLASPSTAVAVLWICSSVYSLYTLDAIGLLDSAASVGDFLAVATVVSLFSVRREILYWLKQFTI